MRDSWLQKKINLVKATLSSQHLFMIGDRLHYPNHGTGKITALESFDNKDFYCIEMDNVRMRILVPIEKLQKVGAVYLETKV